MSCLGRADRGRTQASDAQAALYALPTGSFVAAADIASACSALSASYLTPVIHGLYARERDHRCVAGFQQLASIFRQFVPSV